MLFQTRFGDGYYYSDIVTTDDGCVIASDSYSTIACWDARSQQQRWTCDDPRQKSCRGAAFKKIFLDDSGASLIALGEREAWKIDTATDAVTSRCEYGLDEHEVILDVGGLKSDEGFGCKGNRVAVRLQFSEKTDGRSSDSFDRLCLIDFATGEASKLPERYGWIHSIRFVDNDDVLVSYSDEHDFSENVYAYGHSLLGRSGYTRHAERIDLTRGETKWKADIPLWATSISDSLQVLQSVEASFVNDKSPQQIVAYCTSNVCVVLDLNTGVSLGHFETTESIVVTWPYIKEDKVDGLRGFLADGRDMGGVFHQRSLQ